MSDQAENLELDAQEQRWADDLTADAGAQPGDVARLGEMIDTAVQSAPVPTTAGAEAAGGNLGRLVGIGAIIVAAVAVVTWPGKDPGPAELQPYVREVVQAEPEPEPEPEAPTKFAAATDPSGAPAPDPAIDGVVTGLPSGTVALPGTSPLGPPTKAIAGPSAADLFAQANEARRKHEYDEAIRLYHRLHRLHKGTREAQVSRVALARVLLDEKNEPRRALRLFDAYLSASPKGSLAEEAKAGRALALQKLGRKQDERQAWQEFLTEHPGSAYSAKARTRLKALGTPIPG